MIPVSAANPPPFSRPDAAIYGHMGEENIFAMLSDLYRELEVSSIRPMFADDMQEASRRSAAFFVGLMGGPPLYHERYGAPMMRRRHMSFPIDEAARQEWLSCFYRVLENAEEKYTFPAEHLPGFRLFLDGFSAHMINR